MHEKLVLFRGLQTFIMGDRDLSGRYFGLKPVGEKFLSRDVAVFGPESEAVAKHFDELYNSRFTDFLDMEKEGVTTLDKHAARKRLDEALNSYKKSKLASGILSLESRSHLDIWRMQAMKVKNITFIGDTPNKIDNRSHKALLALIANAKVEANIATPYFIANDENRGAINSAFSNGAKVTLVTNNATLTDERWVPPAADEDLRDLVKKGVAVYENAEQRIFHTKTYTFDYRYTFFGSNNLDNRSQNWDRESAIIIDDVQFTKKMNEIMARDISLSVRYDINRKPYHLQNCQQMINWIVSKILRPVL